MSANDPPETYAPGVQITGLPAKKARGALSVANWSVNRVSWRDKSQRLGTARKVATKQHKRHSKN